MLFVAGSALFSAGGFAATWPGAAPRFLASSSAVGIVFFVGSLFFTAAAALQLLEAQNGDLNELGGEPHRWRWLAWRPTNAGYLASLIQLVGTLLFNANTADALIDGLSWVEDDLLVWTPNVLGSACFLLSSGLAFVEATHGTWRPEPRNVTWWVVVINLLGSVAFGVSAACAFAGPHADAWRSYVANLATFVGAVGFLAASYLLFPEMFDGAARTDATPGESSGGPHRAPPG